MKIECAQCEGENVKVYGVFSDGFTLKTRCIDCGIYSMDPLKLKLKRPEVWKQRRGQ